jgi:prepilin-type N-terminal cleavage/methylation domain-containing protein
MASRELGDSIREPNQPNKWAVPPWASSKWKGGRKSVFQRYRDIKERSENGEVSESGFTLIELLIVIIVLGILAAIVIFSLTGVTGQSKQAACNSDAKTAETAVSAYYAEVGSYPTAWTDLTNTNGHGPYLRTAPSATVGSNGYAINLSPTGGKVLVTNNTTSTGTDYDNGGAAICNGLS